MDVKVAKIQEYAKKLDKEHCCVFHNYVVMAMFLCKISRPDIYQEIFIYILNSQGCKQERLEKIIADCDFLKSNNKQQINLGSR